MSIHTHSGVYSQFQKNLFYLKKKTLQKGNEFKKFVRFTSEPRTKKDNASTVSPPPSRQSFLALEGVERDTQGTRLGNENAENGYLVLGFPYPSQYVICLSNQRN